MTLELHADITPIAQEWDELADRCGVSPLMRPGWYEAWWAAFGSGRLEIAVLRRRGQLVAILPMRRQPWKLQSLFNWHQMEFAVVAEDDSARTELFDEVFKKERRPVTIRFLVRGGPDYDLCVEVARKHAQWVHTRVAQQSPYVAIDGQDWEAYLGSLERKRMADLRRRRRRLMELGELSFRINDGSHDLEADLEAGFVLEESGWKSAAAIAASPTTHRFYTQVARWLAERGWLRLCFLELDGKPFTFDLVIEAAGAAFQVKGGYDPGKRQFAPGVLQRQELLAWAFSRGLDRMEFLGAPNPDKLIWTSTMRERMVIDVFPRSPLGAAAMTAEVYGRPLARRTRDAVQAKVESRRGSAKP